METTNTTTSARWIAYCRTSTQRQNMGLEAQLATIEREAAIEGAEIIKVISEQVSGKIDNRKGLKQALMLARQQNAFVVVAKSDRLSRRLSYLSKLIFDSGVRFRLLDMPPEALENEIVFGVFAGFAAFERRKISQRTSDSLQAIKAEIAAKGFHISKSGNEITALGNPNLSEQMKSDHGNRARSTSIATRKAKAESNENNQTALREVKRYLAEGGKRNYSQIARHLSEVAIIPSPTGKAWRAETIKRLMAKHNL